MEGGGAVSLTSRIIAMTACILTALFLLVSIQGAVASGFWFWLKLLAGIWWLIQGVIFAVGKGGDL